MIASSPSAPLRSGDIHVRTSPLSSPAVSVPGPRIQRTAPPSFAAILSNSKTSASITEHRQERNTNAFRSVYPQARVSTPNSARTDLTRTDATSYTSLGRPISRHSGSGEWAPNARFHTGLGPRVQYGDVSEASEFEEPGYYGHVEVPTSNFPRPPHVQGRSPGSFNLPDLSRTPAPLSSSSAANAHTNYERPPAVSFSPRIAKRDSFIVYPRPPDSPPLSIPKLSVSSSSDHSKGGRTGKLPFPESYGYQHPTERQYDYENDAGTVGFGGDLDADANPEWLKRSSNHHTNEKMSPEEKEERVRMLEAAFATDSASGRPAGSRSGPNVGPDALVSRMSRGRGTVVFREEGRKLRIVVRWLQFLCGWAAAVASFYALVVSFTLLRPNERYL